MPSENLKGTDANLQVRKVDPVPALTLCGIQACGGYWVHLPDLQIEDTRVIIFLTFQQGNL